VLRCRRARQPAPLVFRPFDLDDLGTECAEPARRPRPCAYPAEIDDPDPAKAFMGQMLSFAGLSDTLDLLTSVSRINSITENVRLASRKMGDRAGLKIAVSVGPVVEVP